MNQPRYVFNAYPLDSLIIRYEVIEDVPGGWKCYDLGRVVHVYPEEHTHLTLDAAKMHIERYFEREIARLSDLQQKEVGVVAVPKESQ